VWSRTIEYLFINHFLPRTPLPSLPYSSILSSSRPSFPSSSSIFSFILFFILSVFLRSNPHELSSSPRSYPPIPFFFILSFSPFAFYPMAIHLTSYSTTHHSTVHHTTSYCSTVQRDTVQHRVALYRAVQRSTIQHSTAKHSAEQCCAVQWVCLDGLLDQSLYDHHRPTRRHPYHTACHYTSVLHCV
jgi:hypothetical protein